MLFCKSYDQDMLRARRLAESIAHYNEDNIPFYLCVPAKDVSDFQACFGEIPCTYIAMEEVLARTCAAHGNVPIGFEPHLMPMLLKMEFWRMGLCRYYVWLDSDSYFIRPFGLKDFFYDEDTPYIVQHKLKEIRAFAAKQDPKIISNFEKESRVIQGIFGRAGTCYDFGSPPLIAACEVLENLYHDYLQTKGQTIFQLLQQARHDSLLYGEYYLHSRVIEAKPREQLFKVFHYPEQFFESQMKGESELSLSKDYVGIIMQSNWTNLGEAKRGFFDRLKRLLGR